MSFVATLILTLILTAVPWPLAGLGVVPHWGFLLIAWWGIARPDTDKDESHETLA